MDEGVIPSQMLSFKRIMAIKEPSKLRYPLILGLVGLVLLATVLVFLKVQAINVETAAEVIGESSYKIEAGKISLSPEALEELNFKLYNSGIQLDADGVVFGKTEYLSFAQIQLLLNNETTLDNQSVKAILDDNSAQIQLFLFFYFYVKEGLIFAGVGMLLFVLLARTLQKQISKAQMVSFKQVLMWSAALGIVPLLLYGVLAFLNIKMAPRMFMAAITYILLVFFYGRYVIKNSKLPDEK